MLDHDGVVVDSVEIFTTSFVEACRRVGLSQIATTDDVLALFEGNVYESLRATGADDAQISAAMTRRAGAPSLPADARGAGRSRRGALPRHRLVERERRGGALPQAPRHHRRRRGGWGRGRPQQAR